ncbi:DUF4493 domain-containing protein [uncultured Parabacteroides sp.]|uniref:DUF4493 domain-containing protein n=1 Tax=uncultured Parabacteroides sp. TaxID=512312 RepID=UPI0025FD1F33|nr:DUF4493 domain-containing protein [uncultured Parabacteroides sp.]
MEKAGMFEHPGLLQFGLSADTAGIQGSQELTKAVLPDLTPYLNTNLYKIEILQGEEETVVSSFEHYEDMPDLVELERGNYRVRASMGELKAAAFDAPRFEGVSDFIIKENMTTKLDVTCSLANARVTVAYTDSFKVVYPTYTLGIETSHTTEPFEFVQDEARSGWFQVNAEGEDLKGILTVKPDTGEVKQFTVTIPSVKPKDNVMLTFNSTPNTRPDQGLTVKVTINEEVIDVPVNVFVPDYMLPVNGVNVQLNGFSSGVIQVVKKGVEIQDYSVDITAPGTIGKCLLTITKKEGTPTTYDLANLSEEDRAYLSDIEKLVWDSMSPVGGKRLKKASVSFKKIVEELQKDIPEEGFYLYEYSLTVQDSLKVPHSSGPHILKVKVYPDSAPYLESIGFQNGTTETIMEKATDKDYSVNVKAPNAIDKCLLSVFKDGVQVGEAIDLNNSIPEGITYTKSADGKNATISYKDMIPLLKSGIDTPVEYKYSLVVIDKLPDDPFTSDPMVLQLNITPYIKVYAPRGDIWTNRAKIVMELAHDVKYPVQFEYRDAHSSWMPVSGNPIIEGAKAYISLNGLTQGEEYNIRAIYSDKIKSENSFKTEKAAQLPNSGFEDWYYESGNKDYWRRWYPWSKGDLSTFGWNTVNLKTVGDGWNYQYNSISGTMSTDDRKEGNHAALIRTVGWGKTSVAIGKNSGANHIDVGYLYLGDYNEDTKSPNYGYAFNSRPIAFCFYYKYKAKDDKFLAEIVIQNRSREQVIELGRGSFIGEPIDNYVLKTIDIKYDRVELEPTHIYVVFKSGDRTDKESLLEWPKFANLSDGKYVGSQLYIDEVKLIYPE